MLRIYSWISPDKGNRILCALWHGHKAIWTDSSNNIILIKIASELCIRSISSTNTGGLLVCVFKCINACYKHELAKIAPLPPSTVCQKLGVLYSVNSTGLCRVTSLRSPLHYPQPSPGDTPHQISLAQFTSTSLSQGVILQIFILINNPVERSLQDWALNFSHYTSSMLLPTFLMARDPFLCDP